MHTPPPKTLHQFTYTHALLAPIAELLGPVDGTLLDPFGGLGYKLAELVELVHATPCGIEIEPGYVAHAHPCIQLGDSTALAFPDSSIAAAVTSPVYPNGCTDNFRARDASTRHTYIHGLRRVHGDDYELQPNNVGGTNARGSRAGLRRFYNLNAAVWAEVHRVLTPGAPFVVNTKDTPSEAFTDRTRDQLAAVGFIIEATGQVPVPGLNHGKGYTAKVGYEDLTLARKPAD